jgi:hypothetical protein
MMNPQPGKDLRSGCGQETLLVVENVSICRSTIERINAISICQRVFSVSEYQFLVLRSEKYTDKFGGEPEFPTVIIKKPL